MACSCLLLLRNLVKRSFLSSSNLYRDDAFPSVLNWQSSSEEVDIPDQWRAGRLGFPGSPDNQG